MPQNELKPYHVKEWVILRLKKGYLASRTVTEALSLHGVSISLMTIYRWRKAHVKKTSEEIPLKRKKRLKNEKYRRKKSRFVKKS